MGIRSLADKIQRRIWSDVVRYSLKKKYYPFLYKSYWHFLFNKKCRTIRTTTLYYSARPNPGAGIGHQMANWNAGYWWAKQFGLKFAHLPFSSKSWDDFLGFGEGEITVKELKRKGYKVRRLPLFNEFIPEEVQMQRDIISSYSGEEVCFVAEQDQAYKNQYGVMDEIQRKFYNASFRKNDNLLYDPNNYNIAVHARRGDIMLNPNNPNLKMRILSNEYFFNALKCALELVKTDKDVHVYFFSQGSSADFPEFNGFKNLHWCFDMSAQQSFLHMVYADLLITSKSSFSYKPALLNKGIKVCPKDFWHGYPESDDWFLCNSLGKFDTSRKRESLL